MTLIPEYSGASIKTETVHVVSPAGTLPDTTREAAEAALDLYKKVKDGGRPEESVVLEVQPYGFEDIRIKVTDRHREPEDLMRAITLAKREQEGRDAFKALG